MPSDFRTGLGKKAPVPAKQKRSLYFAFALLPDLVQNIFQNQHCILLVKRMLLLQFIRHHIDSVRIIRNIYFCLIFKQNGVLFPKLLSNLSFLLFSRLFCRWLPELP